MEVRYCWGQVVGDSLYEMGRGVGGEMQQKNFSKTGNSGEVLLMSGSGRPSL